MFTNTGAISKQTELNIAMLITIERIDSIYAIHSAMDLRNNVESPSRLWEQWDGIAIIIIIPNCCKLISNLTI